MDSGALKGLRSVITENLRVQRGGADPIPYIDVSNALNDVAVRQNHAIFARRGCGKTLLLHYSSTKVDPSVKTIYLNCEDFKKHSFPNVLIEILDALFKEFEKHITGWFGRKRRSKELIRQIRDELKALSQRDDVRERSVKETRSSEQGASLNPSLKVSGPVEAGLEGELSSKSKHETELRYKTNEDKIRELDTRLPGLKAQVREFFEVSSSVKAVFLQIDDFYHLARTDQPFVIDYLHRLCKDVPLYFKLATIRHASLLYADRKGQPIGAQERHDYQPINIDFTLAEFSKTVRQNFKILCEFGRLAGISVSEMTNLFKGEGFERLVLAGGGVPRDCLSLFLEVLDAVQPPTGDGRIGKDDVRILSRSNFERRIEELKQDSEADEQDSLIRGIYVLRQFCLDKKTNVIMVPEVALQKDNKIRALLYRLLDYRIIHTAGSALTHKSQGGTFHAFVIDIGCYAHMRVLDRKFNEIDLTDADAKEKMRSGPILDEKAFSVLWGAVPADVDGALRRQEAELPPARDAKGQ